MGKCAAPFIFAARGFDLLIMGRSTPAPRVVAQCRASGQRFTVERCGTVADLLAELAEFIASTSPEVWHRSGVPCGDLAVCEDHTGRRWAIRPPTIAQDGPRSVAGSQLAV